MEGLLIRHSKKGFEIARNIPFSHIPHNFRRESKNHGLKTLGECFRYLMLKLTVGGFHSRLWAAFIAACGQLSQLPVGSPYNHSPCNRNPHCLITTTCLTTACITPVHVMAVPLTALLTQSLKQSGCVTHIRENWIV